MARKKKVEGPELEKEYKTKVRYHCPKRGWVEEEVVVKKYKAVEKVEQQFSLPFMEDEELSLEEAQDIEDPGETVD